VDLEVIAPMVVAVVFIVTTGGVILLRPLSRRLGDLLEVMAAERGGPRNEDEIGRLREHLDLMGERLALLEERQEFTDALLRSPEAPKLRAGGARPSEANRPKTV